jgi:feruloyl esterase
LNFDGDIAQADKLDRGTIEATDPNLKEFFAHGGKLILYHGWSDQMIAPENHLWRFISFHPILQGFDPIEGVRTITPEQ